MSSADPEDLFKLRPYDDVKRPYMPPAPSRLPRRLLWLVLLASALTGAFYGGRWLLENYGKFELVAPWARDKAPDALEAAPPPLAGVPSGAGPRGGGGTVAGQASGGRGRANNTCVTSTPDPDCPPATLPTGPAPESEISRIRAANANAAPAEIGGPREIVKSGTQQLEVGRPRGEATASGGGGGSAAPVVDKGQECDFLKVRGSELEAMLAQNYPAKVKDGLRDEQKRGRSRMAALGC